jgi:multiple sugar transport system substrate-binding protein
MKMNKLKTALALSLSAVTILAGCGGTSTSSTSATSDSAAASSSAVENSDNSEAASASTSAASGEPTELRVTVQAWMMGKYDFEGAKADFEKNHPGVTVTYNQVDNVDVTTSMLEWSQGKTSCDIAIGGDRSQTVSYAANDYIVEFTDDNFFNGDFTRDKFYDPFMTCGNIENHQFMIPLVGETVGIVVNKNMFKEAGLLDENGEIIPAESWEELYDYASKLTKDGQTGLGIDWGSNMMLYTYETCLQGESGTLFADDGKTLNFKGDAVEDFMTTWKKLIDDGYTTTDVFADMDANRSQFKSGQLAMHLAPASRWIEAAAPDVLGEDAVGLMPVPGTDENGSIVYIHGIVIPKVSPNIDLAIQFIKEELLADDFMKDAQNTYGKMSPLKSQNQDLENPYWPTCLSFVKNATTSPLYKDMTKLDTYFQTETQSYLTGAEELTDWEDHLTDYIGTLDLSDGMSN